MDPDLKTALEALAPAAGSGAGEVIAAEFVARPNWVKKCVDALYTALDAKTVVVCRDGTEHSSPDGRTQLMAVIAVWNHLSGEPVKRIIHEVRRGRDAESLQDELTRSPALREAAREMLDAAEKSAGSGAAVEPSAVIDLPPADGAAGSF